MTSKVSGSPLAFVRRWILVEKPPRERLSASHFHSPFYASCAGAPARSGASRMPLVGGRPKARQCLESRVRDTELAPAREAYEDRIPISVSLGHVAPRRTGAQDPENAVDRSPLVRDSRTTFAPIGKQSIENAPFPVRQMARTQCCLLQKGSLKSKFNSSVKNCQHSLALQLRFSFEMSAAGLGLVSASPD